jgi:TnpA family transposase
MTRVGARLDANQLPGIQHGPKKLKIAPLEAQIPDGVDELARLVASLFRRITITDLVAEVDARTDRVALFSALLADATNLGLAKMADACPGLTFKRLAWVADWYIREDGYRNALAEIINQHHREPFAAHWGDGATSSSDGQAFSVGGRRDGVARVNARYGRDPTLNFYTHLSDQYGSFHTKVITGTAKEAAHVLDGLLYHETELAIHTHYTDTGGYTDHVFGLCALLGIRYAPRLRDLADRRLYTFEKPTTYPSLEPLIGGTLNSKQITAHWDALLRVCASLKLGTVTASLLLEKLAEYPRQNSVAWGLREMGRLEKTLHTLEWFENVELRCQVLIGLNKGEGRNALARAVFFYRRGTVHDRSDRDQQQRAQGLNLVVAAIILWNTLEMERIVAELRRAGTPMTDEQLAHLSPMEWEHITLTGEYHWKALARPTRGRDR